jgi:gamma-glutamyl hercynylcysteine S-oxide synthase
VTAFIFADRQTTLPPSLDRSPAARLRKSVHERLHSRLREARFETDRLFGLLRGDAIFSRPVPDRPRLIFYLGHLEAFDWALLCRDGLDMKAFDREFDSMFAGDFNAIAGRGSFDDKASDWPSPAAIRVYGRRVRGALDNALESCAFGGRVVHPTAHDVGAVELAIEHRLMIAEQLAALIHHLPSSAKSRGPLPSTSDVAMTQRWIGVNGGRTVMGLPRQAIRFANDVEYSAHEVDVKPFSMEARNVTNGDFRRFVEAGGYRDASHWSRSGWEWRKSQDIESPALWTRKGASWAYKAMFGDVTLPEALPVHVSLFEAEAYARWNGARLPTEAEYHLAAFGSTDDEEGDRSFPWGEMPPWPSYGVFGFERWDANHVGSAPAGDTPSGISDLMGNGWEWTSTPLLPHPGFTQVPARPGYSAHALDGKHYVLKGASPRTAMPLIRRSFRHYAMPGHRHGYNTFRCVKTRP